MHRRRRFTTVIALIILTVCSAFIVSTQNYSQPAPPPTDVSHEQIKNQPKAVEALQSLEVKGRAPRTGYDRSLFGDGWANTSGCDTRNLILQRDLKGPNLADDNCKVQTGTLNDPYTNEQIQFTRGVQSSQEVQIDHVVALSDAWQKGAQNLTPETRQKLANDSLNLLAVDGPTNMKKSDSDAATWLPPNKAYRCMYVARQIAVKQVYKLWVTFAEQNAMKQVLQTCPDQVLPIKN